MNVKRAARGGVVGVGHAAQPERPGHRLVVADDGGADELDEFSGVHGRMLADEEDPNQPDESADDDQDGRAHPA